MADIGIEWVKQYHGRANNLSNTQAQAEGLYNTLSGVRRFNWGDDLAWDQDFEETGVGSPARRCGACTCGPAKPRSSGRWHRRSSRPRRPPR